MIPDCLIKKAQRLSDMRNSKNGKPRGKPQWSRNLIMRLAIEEYLEKHVAELGEGGATDQDIGEYSSPEQNHRFGEMEKEPLQKIAQKREKKPE